MKDDRMRRRSGILEVLAVLVLCAVLLPFSPAAVQAAAFWSAPSTVAGGAPAINLFDAAVDSSGVMRVCYSRGDDKVRYIHNAGGGWSEPAVIFAAATPGWTIRDISVVAGDDGTVHIMIIDGAEGGACELWDIALKGGSLTAPHVIGHFSAPPYAQGAFWAAGYVHFVISAPGDKDRDYSAPATQPEVWSDNMLRDFVAGRYVVVDAIGRHHSVEMRQSGATYSIFYASDASGSWQEQTVGPPLAYSLSPRITVDKDLRAHIVFVDPQRQSHLFHTSNAADGSTFPAPADISGDSTLAFSEPFDLVTDAAGNTVITAFGAATDASGLWCLTDERGYWSAPQRIAAGEMGTLEPSLSTRSLADYVVYSRADTAELRFSYGPPAGTSAPADVKGGQCVIGSGLSKDWYFAEGYTGPGFNTWLTLQNPSATGTQVEIYYLLEGEVRLVDHYALGGARTTINVNEDIGPGKNVSIRVHSAVPLAVERPVYFSYGPQGWDGGHSVVGATAPALEWYFAEGTTRDGFDEWLCLQNPQPAPATVTVTYMRPSGDDTTAIYLLQPTSRTTISVNAVVENADVSMHVSSTAPIIAERPMYFDYGGSWTGGHCVTGATAAANTWYFAEGNTRAGFDEWLCIQNPENAAARIDLTFMLDGGELQTHHMELGPHTRGTLHVPEVIEAGRDVSVKVESSDGPIVVERPMYFAYNGTWTDGHDVVGATQLGRTFYFAEGCTRAGFEEWLCLQNPGAETAWVTVTYYRGDGTQETLGRSLPAHSRATFSVNAEVGAGHDVAMKVESDKDILAERPMYFAYSLQ
ncbi:MAG: DUF5719 family protein [Candidatus Geothermincolia bacterium]